MNYREATLKDLEAICALGDEVNGMHHLAEPHVFAPGGKPEQHAEHWKTTVEQESATTFLAIKDGLAVGFITVMAAKDTNSLLQPVQFGRIGTVGVRADHRGLGIGNQLMTLAEAWAKSRGCSEVRLTVGAFNHQAAKLYAERGYDVRAQQLVRPLGHA